jgi:hypothetical protein
LSGNKVIGEAGDLVESKDPNSVISAGAISRSSPENDDAFCCRNFKPYRENPSPSPS